MELATCLNHKTSIDACIVDVVQLECLASELADCSGTAVYILVAASVAGHILVQADSTQVVISQK